jgi:hypothetical protein
VDDEQLAAVVTQTCQIWVVTSIGGGVLLDGLMKQALELGARECFPVPVGVECEEIAEEL